MSNARNIRRLAFQALFQLDARDEADPDAGTLSLEDDWAASLTDDQRAKALALAREAYADRRAADEAMRALAPTWPAHRQPAVDRAILRLAHYEMTRGRANPKAVVNDAIELAKLFSTDRSPAFINGLLDKVLKRVLAERSASSAPSGGPGGEPTGRTESDA